MATYEYNLGVNDNIELEMQTKQLANHIVRMLIAERKHQGMTQQSIAENTGMKTSNVARIESCKNTPTLEVLIRYASALGKRLQIDLVD